MSSCWREHGERFSGMRLFYAGASACVASCSLRRIESVETHGSLVLSELQSCLKHQLRLNLLSSTLAGVPGRVPSENGFPLFPDSLQSAAITSMPFQLLHGAFNSCRCRECAASRSAMRKGALALMLCSSAWSAFRHARLLARAVLSSCARNMMWEPGGFWSLSNPHFCRKVELSKNGSQKGNFGSVSKGSANARPAGS